MSYLRFEKALMTNLEESLKKEILRCSRSGAYSSTTIVDCNTRKYHGLLVVPIPEMDDENHVLLSSLDLSVVQHGAEFNLAVHKYQGNNFSPKGHKYIREFNCDVVPTTIYRVGGVVLKKELIFQAYTDRLLLRYTVEDCQGTATLRFRPFLAFRSVSEYTHENGFANRDFWPVDNGIRTKMYSAYPNLYMQFNKKNEFVFQPDWYRGIEYPKEAERGYAATEDLYTPGYFEMNVKKGDSVVFSAATSEIKTSTLTALFKEEYSLRPPRDNFYHTMVNAAHQFFTREGDNDYMLAGYPWFKCRARDTFISLPGLTLSVGEVDRFEKVFDTAAEALGQFMVRKPLSKKIYEIEQPDVPLWAIWALQGYAKSVGLEKCFAKYGDLIMQIEKFIEAGKHPNIELKENSLLWVNGWDRPMTWMNSMANGKPVIPRTGYVVEINALWYNALCFSAELAANRGDAEGKEYLDKLIAKVKQSFQEVFVNQYGYLFDYVDGTGNHDWSLRPNMVFPVAFDYSPLEQSQKKTILDYITRELLTPKGLRTLTPKSGGYNPMYQGPQTQRDYAYHSGTAWPWLGGFYLEACLKVFKRSRLSFVERQMVGYEEELNYHCLGTIPELFDGNPPFHGRGAMSFAMNVAEILRAMRFIDDFNA